MLSLLLTYFDPRCFDQKNKSETFAKKTLPQSSSGFFCKILGGLVYVSCLRETIYAHYNLPCNKNGIAHEKYFSEEDTLGWYCFISYVLKIGCPTTQYTYKKESEAHEKIKHLQPSSVKIVSLLEERSDASLFMLKSRIEFFRLYLCWCPDLGVNMNMSKFGFFSPNQQDHGATSTALSPSSMKYMK